MTVRQTMFLFLSSLVMTIGVCVHSGVAGTDQVKGTLEKLDLETGTITLVFGSGKNAQKETFSLSSPKIPVIAKTGKKTPLKELKPGLTVTLQLSAVGDVEAIVAKAPVRFGIFVSYNPEQQTLLVTGRNGKEQQLQVSKDTEVTINRKESDLSQLRYRHRMMMVMSLDGKEVLSLVARLSREPRDPRGTIIDVDANNGKLTLLESNNGKHRIHYYPIRENFILVFDSEQVKGAKLNDLPVITELKHLHRGLPTWIRLSKDKQVEAIVASHSSIPAKIESVDAKKRTASVKYANGESETFTLIEDADVRIDNRKTTLDRVRPGMTGSLHLSYRPGILVGMKCISP